MTYDPRSAASETNAVPVSSGYKIVTATIANGQSLSGAIDCRGFRVAKIFMPAAWDAAAMTYAESDTLGGTYNPLYADGAEVSGTVAANQVIGVSGNLAALSACQYLKLRSGTNSAAVNQTAERQIKVLLVG